MGDRKENLNLKREAKDDLKKILIERFERLPSNYRISVGSKGTFTKDQVIQSVEEETPLGTKFMKMELEFLRALSRGEFTEILRSQS